MAVTCPVGFDVASLRGEVQTMYSRVAASPDGDFHFHRGPQYAATMLGYDATELAALPSEVTSSFAGVGNPHAIDRISVGATVVDIGCGAGMDLLLAARRTGPTGRAIGIDMTEAMRRRASQGGALRDIDLWTGWIAGALLEAELIDVFTVAGFGEVAITKRFDCFAGTSKKRTARRYGVMGVNLSAVRLSAWSIRGMLLGRARYAQAERQFGPASPAYLDAAGRGAESRSVADRLQCVVGDFAILAEGIESADIVTMHRVVCCYPDDASLLRAAARHARRVLAFWYPRGPLVHPLLAGARECSPPTGLVSSNEAVPYWIETRSWTDMPIACTVSDDVLRIRKDGLLARVAVCRRNPTLATGTDSSFPATSDALTQVTAMIDAERQCCRFFRLTLKIEPDLGPISLERTGPDGTHGFLEALFDPA